MPTPIILSVA